jgi:hypothetical protein
MGIVLHSQRSRGLPSAAAAAITAARLGRLEQRRIELLSPPRDELDGTRMLHAARAASGETSVCGQRVRVCWRPDKMQISKLLPI